MTIKMREFLLSIVAISTCLFFLPLDYAQLRSLAGSYQNPRRPLRQTGPPIERDQLFYTLENNKLSTTGLNWLIRRVKERKVSFQLSDADKISIRRLENHLPKAQLDDLIDTIQSNYRTSTTAIQPNVIPFAPSPSPSPTPDWNETQDAKKLRAQLLKELEDLIKDGNQIPVTNFETGVQKYNDWAKKCLDRLGALESDMTAFYSNNSPFREDFFKTSPRVCVPTNRSVDDSDKTYLQLAIDVSVKQLRSVKREVCLHTLSDKEARERDGHPEEESN